MGIALVAKKIAVGEQKNIGLSEPTFYKRIRFSEDHDD